MCALHFQTLRGFHERGGYSDSNRWHTQAEGNGLCSSLIWKLPSEKEAGGIMISSSLGDRAYREKGLPCPHWSKTQWKKNSNCSFYCPKMLMEHCQALCIMLCGEQTEIRVYSQWKEQVSRQILVDVYPSSCSTLQAALGPEEATFSAKSKARAAGVECGFHFSPRLMCSQSHLRTQTGYASLHLSCDYSAGSINQMFGTLERNFNGIACIWRK